MGLSIFEKISVIFEMFLHTPFVFLFLLFVLMIAGSLLIHLYVHKKYLKFIFPIFYILFIAMLMLQYHTYLIKGVKLFLDDLFFQVYFPSIALYFFILMINFIALLVSICKKKITNYSKIVTIISFCLLQLLFALFLFTISVQNLELTDWSRLYQNKEILSILEISISTFFGWIFLLIIGYGLHMINKESDKQENDIVLSYDNWQQLNHLVKENILKLSEEVEQLKKQLLLEREQTNKQFIRLEQNLEQSNQFFIEKLKNTTSEIKNSTLLDDIEQLQAFVERNLITFQKQLTQIKEEMPVSSEYVKTQVMQVEQLILKNNKNVEQQMSALQKIPSYELEQMKIQMKDLETLMKRYIMQMNYQLVQTRKEMMIQKQNTINKNS